MIDYLHTYLFLTLILTVFLTMSVMSVDNNPTRLNGLLRLALMMAKLALKWLVLVYVWVWLAGTDLFAAPISIPDIVPQIITLYPVIESSTDTVVSLPYFSTLTPPDWTVTGTEVVNSLTEGFNAKLTLINSTNEIGSETITDVSSGPYVSSGTLTPYSDITITDTTPIPTRPTSPAVPGGPSIEDYYQDFIWVFD